LVIRDVGPNACEDRAAHAVRVSAPNRFRGESGVVGVGKVAIGGLVFGGGEDSRVVGYRPADEQAPAAGTESPSVGASPNLQARLRTQRVQVQGASKSIGPVDGGGGAVHDLYRLEQDGGHEREVEVPNLRIGKALAVEKKGGLGGPRASQRWGR